MQCGQGRGLLLYQVASTSMHPFGHNRHGPKIGGVCVHFFLGVDGSPSNTKTPVLRLPPYHGYKITMLHTKWHLDASSRLATIKMRRKLGALPPFLVRAAGSRSSTIWPGPRHTSMTSAILIHPAVWPQYSWAENWGGGSVPFWGGELRPHLTQCRLSRGLPPYQVHLDPCSRLATIEMGRKLGMVPPLFGRGAWSPSNTKSP